MKHPETKRWKQAKTAGRYRTSQTPIGRLMAARGITQADIARDLDITAQAVNSALAGRSVNARVLTEVRSRCGVPLAEVVAMVRDYALERLAKAG